MIQRIPVRMQEGKVWKLVVTATAALLLMLTARLPSVRRRHGQRGHYRPGQRERSRHRLQLIWRPLLLGVLRGRAGVRV